MTEFDGKSHKELERYLFGLVTYRQSCIDFFNIIKETHERTTEFYNEKISLCEEYINNLKNEN